MPPPKLVNTGTDYVAILKSIESYGNWMAAHRPDAALVSTIIAEGTREHELFVRDMTRLRAANKRAIEILGGPSTYKILSARPDAFSAQVREDIRFHKSIDSSGAVFDQVQYTTPTTYLVLVVLARGHWFFAAEELQEVGRVHL